MLREVLLRPLMFQVKAVIVGGSLKSGSGGVGGVLVGGVEVWVGCGGLGWVWFSWGKY